MATKPESKPESQPQPSQDQSQAQPSKPPKSRESASEMLFESALASMRGGTAARREAWGESEAIHIPKGEQRIVSKLVTADQPQPTPTPSDKAEKADKADETPPVESPVGHQPTDPNAGAATEVMPAAATSNPTTVSGVGPGAAGSQWVPSTEDLFATDWEVC